MTHFCTYGDIKYLNKGLALFKSLKETFKDEFVLHWLCLDNDTYLAITTMLISGEPIRPYLLSALESNDPILAASKNNDPSEYALLHGDKAKYVQYCWALAPYWVNYCLKTFVESGEKLIYCDNDIYFYHSPEIILDIVAYKSIGIHTHRFGGRYSDDIDVGWYNVGVMVFKKDEIGIAVSESWKNWILHPDHDFYEKYGRCGDQGYLNLFIPLFGRNNICIFDEDANKTDLGFHTCMHLAAWNSSNQIHTEKEGDWHWIKVKGKTEPVVFYHFSHFREDIENDKWYDSLHGEWNPSADPNVKRYYEEYFKSIKQVSYEIDFVCDTK